VVVEVDDAGDRVAMVHLDPDDLDAAYAELDRRYAAGEAAPYARTWETLQRFAAAGDWDELASVFDPDLVLEDHRPIGWGTLHSRDEYLAMIRALVDLAPDLSLRLEHVLALDDRRTLGVGRAAGSWEGGPFEMPFVAVVMLGPDGRIQRFHQYDLEQLDAARARFEAIRVGAASDPLAALARPNAASATEGQPISSVGPFELEALWVTEVDESGRLTAGVAFDVDDWRAATREAYARWFASDAVAAASVGPVFDLIERMNERDRARLRAV